ncbi:CrpP-related protein [Achromobacter sp.]|uniref:CrpP-related protein n=1 Tax=Achromobacter sp. TaxID=134375 RepID=UPI0028AFC258|nr:CrpP-related protein [Achromobacter sp.]
MQRDDIQKLGAQAAREGLTLWDCPYYRAAAMPGHTGESIADWRGKVEAWEAGWMKEMESGQPPPGGGIRYVPRATARHRH